MCRSMGDAREPREGGPLARVHVLADRASRRGVTRTRTADDPRPPSLVLDAGRVVELDGRAEPDFDAHDAFVARHALDLGVAEEAMALDEVTFGRMTVHPAVPLEELSRLAAGMTPAKLAASLAALRPAELTMAARRLQAPVADRQERSAQGEVLVLVPARTPEAAPTGGDTPWSSALLVSSYAARGMRSRVVTGGGRPGSSPWLDREALRPTVSRVVLTRAIGAWGVAPARAGENDPRWVVEELVARLLGLESRTPVTTASGGADDFGDDAAGLRRRAALLAEAGRHQLAGTLARAAELLALDDAEVARLCGSLRLGSDPVDLTAEAAALRERGSDACAAFFDEAATVYGLLGLSG